MASPERFLTRGCARGYPFTATGPAAIDAGSWCATPTPRACMPSGSCSTARASTWMRPAPQRKRSTAGLSARPLPRSSSSCCPTAAGPAADCARPGRCRPPSGRRRRQRERIDRRVHKPEVELALGDRLGGHPEPTKGPSARADARKRGARDDHRSRWREPDRRRVHAQSGEPQPCAGPRPPDRISLDERRPRVVVAPHRLPASVRAVVFTRRPSEASTSTEIALITATLPYLALTIGMTFQVSDTDLTGKRIRRTALHHALTSYVFETVIVAITVGAVAALVGG